MSESVDAGIITRLSTNLGNQIDGCGKLKSNWIKAYGSISIRYFRVVCEDDFAMLMKGVQYRQLMKMCFQGDWTNHDSTDCRPITHDYPLDGGRCIIWF